MYVSSARMRYYVDEDGKKTNEVFCGKVMSAGVLRPVHFVGKALEKVRMLRDGDVIVLRSYNICNLKPDGRWMINSYYFATDFEIIKE